MKPLRNGRQRRKKVYVLAVGIAVVLVVAAGAIAFKSHHSTSASSDRPDSGAASSTATSGVNDTTISAGPSVAPAPGAPPAESTGSGATTGTRGWARVKNGTLMSDEDTLLRGATLWFVPVAAGQYEWATSSAPWPYFAEYHLNTVRLAVVYGPRTDSADPLSLSAALSDLDTAVREATAHHLYAVIDLHWGAGAHDEPSAITFWKTVAARYKNDTNVIYEVLNEPVAWNPKDYNSQDIADEETLYQIIRSEAPQTPILLMTFPIPVNTNSNKAPTMTDVVNKLTGINWNNTVVAFHGYWTNTDAGEKQLKAKYPTMNTEYQFPSSGSGENRAVDGDAYQTQVMEKDGISWICWNCDDIAGDTSLLAGMEANAKANGYWWPEDSDE
jgi:Cellulase (glycosyl hydrolase family 5)